MSALSDDFAFVVLQLSLLINPSSAGISNAPSFVFTVFIELSNNSALSLNSEIGIIAISAPVLSEITLIFPFLIYF